MTAVLVGAVGAVMLVGLVLAVRTAARLDRLHRRVDTAWSALAGLLVRRAAVVRTLTVVGALPPALGLLADRAEYAPAADRADAERRLSAAVSTAVEESPELALAVLAELVDAEQRVQVGAGIYNDAVRDTRALRSRLLVRVLRLAGRARLPGPFAVAPVPVAHRRPSGRVLLVDGRDRVLLMAIADPSAPNGRFWCTPGGGSEPGESARDTAVRELAEETGLAVAPEQLGAPVWFRRASFAFEGVVYEGAEWFFLLRVPDGHEVRTDGWTELERAVVTGYRWWSAADLIAQLERVYPVQLPEALPALLAADGTRPCTRVLD